MWGSLWVGWDDGKDNSIPALNVFVKDGNTFRLIKSFDGDYARMVYTLLTEEGDYHETSNTM